MTSFQSLYSHEFIRVASCVPRTRVAALRPTLPKPLLWRGRDMKAKPRSWCSPNLACQPTPSRTCFSRMRCSPRWSRQSTSLVEISRDLFPVLVVGAPLRHAVGLFNTGVVINRGSCSASCRRPICRITANSTRNGISPRAPACADRQITVAGRRAPFGVDLLFRSAGSVGCHFSRRDLRGFLGAAAAFEHGRHGWCRGAGQSFGEQYHHRQG